MSKKKFFIIGLSVAICLPLLVFLTVFLISTFRYKLPEYPDFSSVPEPLQEQISEASRKAKLIPTAHNLGELGLVYYSSMYYEKAARCFQLAVRKNSGEWIWNYYLGHLNMEMGETKISIANFRNVISKDPDNWLALYYMAEGYETIGLLDSAKSLFLKITSMSEELIVKKDTLTENDFPLQTYAMYCLARIYANTNNSDSARIYLNEIIRTRLTFGPAYRLLGNIFNSEGDSVSGNRYTARANDMIGYTPPRDWLTDKISLMSRSDTYLLKKMDEAIRSLNFKWALKLFDHSLKYYPDNKFVLSTALTGYFNLGLEGKAKPYLNKHRKYYSDDFQELLNFATLLYNKGDFQESLEYFNQARKIKPDDSMLILWMVNRGLGSDAVSLLKDRLVKDPENINTLRDAVRLYTIIGDKEMAKKYLDTIRLIDPSHIEIVKLTGQINETNGNLKGAISGYEDAIRRDPDDLFIIIRLADLYFRESQWGYLITHYRKALINFPNEPLLLEGLGRILITCPDERMRNIEEGMEYSERAFINYKSSFSIKLSSGKYMVTAFAISGYKEKADKYIKLLTDMAGKGNVIPDYIPYLENLRNQYQIL